MTKTQEIAGVSVTLEAGRRYRASSPMCSGTVNVEDMETKETVLTLTLGYDRRNEFLGKFNNGETSFDGRPWE